MLLLLGVLRVGIAVQSASSSGSGGGGGGVLGRVLLLLGVSDHGRWSTSRGVVRLLLLLLGREVLRHRLRVDCLRGGEGGSERWRPDS